MSKIEVIAKKDLPEEIELAYGENKSQSPAHLLPGTSSDPLAMSKFQVISGDPSHIAVADGDQIVHILRFLAEAFRRNNGQAPYIVVAGKHANPCGIAIDWDDPVIAVRKALCGNKVAIMGGEVVTNFPIDDQLGLELYQQPPEMCQGEEKKWGLDLVLAPSFSSETVELLGKKEKRRLLANPALVDAPFPKKEWMLKHLYNGDDVLRQRFQNFVLTKESIIHWTSEPLRGADFDSLLIAWVATWNATSNTVGLAKNRMLIGLGCGQQDRIECVRLGVDRAIRSEHETANSVFASDAFFPFASNERPELTDAQLHRWTALLNNARNQNQLPDHRFSYAWQVSKEIMAMDNREGPEILVWAGCKGGVVPADGNRLEEVKEYFEENHLSVGFVDPANRGFSKH